MTLIDGGIYPYFIGSHTSAWAQPNDNGYNALFHSLYGAAVQLWRTNHPFMPFDRVASNWCIAEAVRQVLIINACTQPHNNTIHAHTQHNSCTHTTQFSNSAIHARTQHNSCTHTTQFIHAHNTIDVHTHNTTQPGKCETCWRSGIMER